MTCPFNPMEKFVALCVEGARRFGDDPDAIANFIEKEIGQLPDVEQRQFRQQLTLLTGSPHISE